jgi:hypothetical protein
MAAAGSQKKLLVLKYDTEGSPHLSSCIPNPTPVDAAPVLCTSQVLTHDYESGLLRAKKDAFPWLYPSSESRHSARQQQALKSGQIGLPMGLARS